MRVMIIARLLAIASSMLIVILLYRHQCAIEDLSIAYGAMLRREERD